MNGNACSRTCWLLHSIRCVLITPFGMPVEPEVNRNLAIVSGPTRAWAFSAASTSPPLGTSWMTSIFPGKASIALPKAWGSDAYTSPGVSSLKIARSLPKSDESSE